MPEGASYERVDTEEKDRAIATLKDHVLAMAQLATSMVEEGTTAMLEGDEAKSRTVLQRDAELDRFDIDIESETIRLIGRIQPEARYLRTLGSVLKIANCLDRIGRLGYDMARHVSSAPEPADTSPKQWLKRMDVLSRHMVEQAMQAFMQNDAELAKSVFALDDDVDELYRDVLSRLIMLLEQGGLSAERLAHELLAARHLERVGDNACKIAEKTVYAITGERRTEFFPRLAHRVPAPGPEAP